jgi:hypothetical protein
MESEVSYLVANLAASPNLSIQTTTSPEFRSLFEHIFHAGYDQGQIKEQKGDWSFVFMRYCPSCQSTTLRKRILTVASRVTPDHNVNGCNSNFNHSPLTIVGGSSRLVTAQTRPLIETKSSPLSFIETKSPRQGFAEIRSSLLAFVETRYSSRGFVESRSSRLDFTEAKSSPLGYIETRSSPLSFPETKSSPVSYLESKSSSLGYIETIICALNSIEIKASPLGFSETKSSPLGFVETKSSPHSHMHNKSFRVRETGVHEIVVMYEIADRNKNLTIIMSR